MNQISIIFCLLLIIATGNCFAATESAIGKWLAPDESTPGITSIVDLYVRKDHLYGRILITRNAQGQEIHPLCENCPGPLRGMPIKGMEFIKDLKPGETGWVDGQVMDLRPGLTQGVLAACDVSMEKGKAVIFGYMWSRAFGKSSTWTRVKDEEPANPGIK